MKIQLSTKRLQINKANARMVAILAASSVITVFSLVAARTLISQSTYQQRIIAERSKANDQLKKNVKSVSELVQKYQDFDSAPENVIGGNPDPNSTGERDGPNSRIVLDALPSKYDFPALATSLEKILLDGGYKIEGIVGSDDELTQSKQESTPNPEPVDMPFMINAGGSYAAVQKLVTDFERSIRPFHMQQLDLVGNDGNMTVSLQAKTYYQPEKNLEIKTKEVK